MHVSEDEVAEVPAPRFVRRTAVSHGEEGRKQRDEALAFPLAPIAPNADLPGIRGVVNDLRRIGINDNANWDVSLLKLLPEERHLCLLPGDAALHSERRIAIIIGSCFIHL